MEKAKDILDSIGDRLKSPLIFSFLISWIFTNWQILIALFWLGSEDLHKLGYISHIDYVQSKLSFSRCFVFPFCLALLYTFGFPFVRNLIAVFSTKVNTIGERKRLKASEGAIIPVHRYVTKVKIVEAKEKLLEEQIATESLVLNKKDLEILDLTEQLSSLNAQQRTDNQIIQNLRDGMTYIQDNLATVQRKLSAFERSEDHSKFNGDWEVKIGPSQKEWNFQDGAIRIVTGSNNFDLGRILFSNWNIERGSRVILMISFNSDQNHYDSWSGKKILLELYSSPSGKKISGNYITDGQAIEIELSRTSKD
jgi:hypothetical protein